MKSHLSRINGPDSQIVETVGPELFTLLPNCKYKMLHR
jgi:hypothetical protein